MPRTTVIGSYDHGVYGALEKVSDHLPNRLKGWPRQTFWRIYSRRAVICTGALERPIAFHNNDRPGILLAGAVRSYVNRWAVTPAQRVAVFCNNDDAYRT
ncbi:MAG: sarcosine oxidase subunit alpha, partial [Bacteroidetes bacterium]|nr:sarcosine oxidase subunit alpha [Bacteroidota bacterium]